MAITLNGTTGITTPDVTSDSYTGALAVNASAPDNSLVVNSSGNVGIGTSSPNRLLDIATSNAGGSTLVSLVSATDGNCQLLFGDTASDTQGKVLYNNSGDYMAFNTADAERARIDSSGNLLVGKTSTSNGSTGFYVAGGGNADFGMVNVARPPNTTMIQIVNSSSSTVVGQISQNGSSTTYSTSSDYRLKENVVGVTGAAARVQQLNPVRFNFIADPDTTVDGFLAHEVQDVVPEAITGTKDAVETYTDDEGNEQTRPVYQGIDQSKLVPLLTAALQEALTKIDSLETRIAALEAA